MNTTPEELARTLSLKSQSAVQGILGKGNTVDAALSAARDSFRCADEQLRHLDVMQPEPRPACTKGCSWCCYGGCVAVTVPEAIAIAAHINELDDETVKAEVLARLESQGEFVNKYGSAAAWAPRLACPLLDESTGSCMVYDSRPLKCRAWASLDAEACRRSTEAGGSNDPDIPLDPASKVVNEAVLLGQTRALTAGGLDASKYELVTAVLVAIRNSKAVEQWTAGSSIPASRPISPTAPGMVGGTKMLVPGDQRAKNRAKRDRKRLRNR